MKLVMGLSICAMLATTSVMADHLSVSANDMNFNYKEYSTNGQPLDSEETSSLYGFTIKYAHDIFGSKATTNQSTLFANISFYGSNSNYTGALLSSTNPIYGSATGTTQNKIVNGKIGYRQSKNLKSVTLYTRLAIGYRYWDRKLSFTQDEKYQWEYGNIKIGLNSHL